MNPAPAAPPRLSASLLNPLLILAALVGTVYLGSRHSPLGEDGRPLLLTPRMLQVGSYRDQAIGWIGDLYQARAGLEELLADPRPDLLLQDARASRLVSDLALLQEELERSNPPAGMETLRAALLAAVSAYQQAAGQAVTWIGRPTTENLAAAHEALEAAARSLEAAWQDPWLKTGP